MCIATPDHWHAYITVEACKAGKDVYVEKPACKGVDEGIKMVQAARKYNRVVQAGTMQRSGGNFRKAAELVAAGVLGEITFCHTFQSETTKRERCGNLPDASGAGGSRLGHVAGTRAGGAFQPQPLGRARHLSDLPLFLGLRRRRHDRLGRAPHRPAAPVLRRSYA